MRHWQRVLKEWLIGTLGKESYEDPRERFLRLFEEVIELGQAMGVAKEAELFQVIDTTLSRPVGNVRQEFGGVMVTLCCLAENQNESLLDCLIIESNRIHDPKTLKRIRDRQKEKKEQGL